MTIEDDVRAVALKQATGWAFVRGAVFVGAILLASVQWYALHQLDVLTMQGKQVAEHTQRLAVLDMEVARMRSYCIAAVPTSYDGPVQEVKRR